MSELQDLDGSQLGDGLAASISEDGLLCFTLTVLTGQDGRPEADLSREEARILDSAFDVTFELTVPGEIIAEETNADEIDGQTLVWRLSASDSGRVLEARSRLPARRGLLETLAVWAPAVMASAAAAAGWHLYTERRRRKREEAEAQPPAEPAPPVDASSAAAGEEPPAPSASDN